MELLTSPGIYIAGLVFLSLLSFIWIPIDLTIEDNDDPED